MAPSTKLKSSAQFIADAKKKVLPPEKMTEALEKIRKGATASLSLPKVINILDHLGWKVEPMSAWISLHYKDKENGRWILQHAHVYRDEPVERKSGIPFDDLHKKLLSEEVTKLPDRVTVGKRIFMDVTPVKDGGSPGARYFEWKEWVGCDGFRLTSPRNEVIELLPDRYYVGKTFEVSISYESLLNKAGWKEDASNALGKEMHVPAAMRTRLNTGTCPVCVGNYKLSAGHLVLHGYERPGWGHVSGQCYGKGWEPLETSVAGARKWLEKLGELLKKEKTNLLKIESNQVSELCDRKGVWHKPGSTVFHQLYERFVSSTNGNIKLYEADIVTYNKVVNLWKPRPMPKEGEPQRDLRFFLKP